MSDQFPMVIGDIRGYRAWCLEPEGFLSSTSQRGTLDPNRRKYTAECRRASRYIDFEPPSEGSHCAPHPTCHCGYYAVYQGGLRMLLSRAGVTPIDKVLGSVRMSGAVIMGETGVMRAEHMELEALFISPTSTITVPMQRFLEEQYEVPVNNNILDFLTHYSLQDGNDACHEEDVRVLGIYDHWWEQLEYYRLNHLSPTGRQSIFNLYIDSTGRFVWDGSAIVKSHVRMDMLANVQISPKIEEIMKQFNFS